MAYRRHSVISQPALPGMASDPLVEWMRLRNNVRKRSSMTKPHKKRQTAAEKRLLAARRDPRQVSLFGTGHTDELMPRNPLSDNPGNKL